MKQDVRARWVYTPHTVQGPRSQRRSHMTALKMEQVMYAVVQHQGAAYDDEPFDVTIGVYTTEDAAKTAADEMETAHHAAAIQPVGDCKHSVQPIPINTIIADRALPWTRKYTSYDVMKHFEHIKPGYCGPPPVVTEGVLREYNGVVSILPGPKADEVQAKLYTKLAAGNVSIHDKRKIKQLVAYCNNESMMAVLQLLHGIEFSELETKVLKVNYRENYRNWDWVDEQAR